MEFTPAEIALIRAAASLAAHAPGRMHAGHLASPLEELAGRMAARIARESRGETPPTGSPGLPRAA